MYYEHYLLLALYYSTMYYEHYSLSAPIISLHYSTMYYEHYYRAPLPMNKRISEQPSPWRKSSKRKSCYEDRVYSCRKTPAGGIGSARDARCTSNMYVCMHVYIYIYIYMCLFIYQIIHNNINNDIHNDNIDKTGCNLNYIYII